MRSGRSALGVIAGVLLGLGIVALSGSSLGLYTIPSTATLPSSPQTTANLGQTVTSTSTGAVPIGSISGTTSSVTFSAAGQPPLFSFGSGGNSLSQVNSIAKQPVTSTAVVLLPVLAGLLFGVVLYRGSKAHNEEDEPSASA